ncbi:lipocalin-like domain-containing protein [Roseiflexus sp.]|uniref:lipocalin-like domain-containing protein n=1 Tax=Roseiflexus sp. TaxID=2562120 RepID=UPI00398AD0F0
MIHRHTRHWSVLWQRLALIVVVVVMLSACSVPATTVEPRARLAVAEAMAVGDTAGFARATEPRPFVFPRDHGPHPEYAIEWWYYTGNLQSPDGRRFGFQFTIFRTGLMPGDPQRSSAWASNSIYMAHFALSDITGGMFHAFERFSRGAAELAGAQSEPFRVWLEDWVVEGQGPDGTPMRLYAAAGDVAIDLTLAAGKPPVLQGDRGLSQKSADAGNASYYYSFTRMPVTGAVRTGTSTHQVSGLSWMDREWSTSALGEDQVGWDWFALHLDDGRDLMFYRLRLRNGGIDPFSKGVLVSADGAARRLNADDVLVEPLDEWTSPRSGATYPARWRLRVPAEAIDLTLTPLLADQELPVTVVYWEGAVSISGSAGGSGYIEMTGYTPDDR